MATTKELVEQINHIFKENKMEDFVSFLADDIVWEMHSSSTGHTVLRGVDEISKMDAGDSMPTQLNFEFGTIVIEGDTASVECTSSGTTPDGRVYKGTSCDIYHFKADKIVRMTSYVIDAIE